MSAVSRIPRLPKCIVQLLILSTLISLAFSPTRAAAYTSCYGTPAAGSAQDQYFFSGVLSQMGITDTQFARDAFMAWKPYENTAACWNPLATTYHVAWFPAGTGCTETIFNSVGVRNYSSKWCGQLATARTLLYSGSGEYYRPIRDMLAQRAFNWQALHDSVKRWVGSESYATSITNRWQDLWNHRGPTTIFSTSWESGQPQGYYNWLLYSRSFAGYYNSWNPGPEAGPVPLESWATPSVYAGSRYLRVAGYSQASYAFAYFKLFATNIRIQNGMKLRYRIYTYQGRNFAIDGHFTDGNTIRDLYNGGYLRDQNGYRIHPAYQGVYGTGYWRSVVVDLSRASGKTLDYLMVAFDNGNNGYTGKIRAYIDNLSITVP